MLPLPPPKRPNTQLAASRFKSMYEHAAPIQASLAVVGGAAALVAASQGGHCSKVLWGGSGALLLGIFPWTMLAMVRGVM
jgi:hypothetical protein